VYLDWWDNERRFARLPALVAGLSVTDRMKLLDRDIDCRRPPTRGFALMSQYDAHQAVTLATEHPENPMAADLIFDANTRLGLEALRGRDKQAAVQYLFAATETRGSERLRYVGFTTELPRSLVDRGERSAVAEFLDRCVRFSSAERGRQLQDWASQIPKGTNPDLQPSNPAVVL